MRPGDVIPFAKPAKEPVKQEWRVPNAIEWLERLGFRFTFEDNRVTIGRPHTLELGLPPNVNQHQVASAIAQYIVNDEALRRAIHNFVKDRHDTTVSQSKAVLVGGPCDGERIPASIWGGTFCRNIRRGWWAIYVRKHGNLHADFRGYATSETKGKTNQLAIRAEVSPSCDGASAAASPASDPPAGT